MPRVLFQGQGNNASRLGRIRAAVKTVVSPITVLAFEALIASYRVTRVTVL